jgi:2'-5' RNA ligase
MARRPPWPGLEGLGDRAAARALWWPGWAATRATAGRRVFTLPPSGPAAAVHLTTVVRLPATVTAALAPTLDRLRALGPRHHYYPPETMHVTVQNLDALAPAAAPPRRPGGPAPPPDGLAELVAARAPFRLAVRGLGVAPGAVFALALAGDATMASLRAGLAGLAGGHDRGRLGRGLGHANLVRFSGPVTAGFLAELARLRRLDFGTFTVDEVELVRTDRLLSPEGTTTLGRLRLEGRAG